MYMKQFFLLLAALLAGYAISLGFHLPLPANVIGMLLLFAAILVKWIDLSAIEQVSDFIIDHLALFFVAPTVGVMQYFDLIRTSFFKIMIPVVAALVVGYAVAGWVTQGVIALQNKIAKEREE